MAKRTKGSKLNIDLGARAEAKLEIKGEIPSSSIGRMVDAFTDVIRPFTETRGLKADLLRVQREEVAIEIAKLARKRIEVENAIPGPVPNKILVPLIEKSSCEDISDQSMVERWANLLASASIGAGVEPRFIGIMEELSGAQAECLELIAFGHASKHHYPTKIFSDSFIENAQHNITSNLNDLISRVLGDSVAAKRLKKNASTVIDLLQAGFEQPGVYLIYASVTALTTDLYVDYDSVASKAGGDSTSFAILESLGLIRTVALRFTFAGDVSAFVEYCHLTELGIKFIEVTARPKVQELEKIDIASRKAGIPSLDREF